ncbi:MAG: hypothetical protein OER95_18155, partial [Acidimicrobiia bacterium]|nr:hypothetical protein [Acidimicrobiia bacterium]
MSSEDSPQQSDGEGLTTLGAAGIDAGETEDIVDFPSCGVGPAASEWLGPVPAASRPELPSIDDVTGLEDLYVNTRDRWLGDDPELGSPTPPPTVGRSPEFDPVAAAADEQAGKEATTGSSLLEFAVGQVASNVADHALPDDPVFDDDFNPTQTQPVEVSGGRLPPPIDLGADLKLSFEPGAGRPRAWPVDDVDTDVDLVATVPAVPIPEPVLQPIPPGGRIRLPGEQPRPPTVAQSIADLADRRRFWVVVAGVGTAAVAFALLASNLISDGAEPGGVPDVVADNSDSTGSITPQAVTDEEEPADGFGPSSPVGSGAGGAWSDDIDQGDDEAETTTSVGIRRSTSTRAATSVSTTAPATTSSTMSTTLGSTSSTESTTTTSTGS